MTMADLNTITCSLKPHSGAFGTYYGQIMSRISQNGVYSSHVINIYTQKKTVSWTVLSSSWSYQYSSDRNIKSIKTIHMVCHWGMLSCTRKNIPNELS